MDDGLKSFQNQQNICNIQSPTLVKSNLHQKYKLLNKITFIPTSKSQQKFYSKNIAFNSNEPYQNFHFEVEKLFHSFPFYIIHVQIAHFSLDVKVLICSDCNPPLIHLNKNQKENIFFAEYEKSKICIKSFNFKNQFDFQMVFAMAIKEWSILKICSVLQCAPHIESCFGFDMIIYDKCVQFACEKGEKITSLSSIQQKQLKESLSLMHNFKIIHFDIKPENIVFSRHLERPVFIDFGFSEIVREQCGYKTLSLFRGTPNFSSPQVLAIMNESYGYVDLYYNDAFGLYLSLKCIKINNIQDSVDLCVDSYSMLTQNYEQQVQQIRMRCKETVSYLKFQYCYLSGDEFKARKHLKDLLSFNKNYAYKALSLIKRVMKERFISQIFPQDLRQYQNCSKYAEIEICQKLNSQRMFFKPEWYEWSLASQRTDNTPKIEPIQFNGNSRANEINFHHYNKILMEISNLQEETIHHYLAITFQSIRFDIRNVDFSTKLMLVRKVMPFLQRYMGISIIGSQEKGNKQVEKEQTEQQGINIVKSFIVLLLEFCYKNKIQKWVKSKIFDIFQQTILLDLDCSQLIESFLLCIDAHHLTAIENILAALQCKRLIQSTKMMITEHVEHSKQVQQKLSSFSQTQTNKYREKAIDTNNLQYESICKILDIINQTNTSQTVILVQDAQESLMHIKNSKVRRYLRCQLTNIKIKSIFTPINSQQMLALIEYVKNSELRKLDFLSYVRLNLKLINYSCCNDDVITFCAFIKSVINCNYIYRKLNITQNRINLNAASISTRIAYSIKKYQQQKDCNQFEYQLATIIGQIENSDMIFGAELHQKLLSLYEIYKQINKTDIVYDEKKNSQYFKVFHQIKTEYFYYCLSEQTKGLFISKRTYAQQELLRSKNVTSQNSLKFAFLCFRSAYYKFNEYFYERKYQQCISILNQLVNICINIKITFLALEMFIDLISVSIIYGKQEVILKASLLLHDFCKNNNLYSFYLLQRCLNNSVVTLTAFARHREELFHELLIKLTKLVCNYPLDGYFSALLIICERFLRYNPTQLGKLHYSKFEGKQLINLQNNPYLLIFYGYSLSRESPEVQTRLLKAIAANCDRLSEYARKKILQQYFCIFLISIAEEKQSKKRFIFQYAKCFINFSQFNKNFARIIFKVNKNKGRKSQKWTNKAKCTKIITFLKKTKNYLKCL